MRDVLLRLRAAFLALVTLVAPPLVSGVLRVLAKTLRVRLVGHEELFVRLQRQEQAILAFWHNRLLMMPLVAPPQPICVMVSAHRDGEIAVRALRRWNIQAVRGSARRGGAHGLLQLVRAYRRGLNLAVVPDGPTGPCYVAKVGVIHLARLTGAPIYPVSYAASRAARLRSWDRLLVPLPFARVAVVVGEPLYVAGDEDPGQIENLRVDLENRMNALNHTAEAYLAR